jgi:hypothetical protein
MRQYLNPKTRSQMTGVDITKEWYKKFGATASSHLLWVYRLLY